VNVYNHPLSHFAPQVLGLQSKRAGEGYDNKLIYSGFYRGRLARVPASRVNRVSPARPTPDRRHGVIGSEAGENDIRPNKTSVRGDPEVTPPEGWSRAGLLISE
jgi:hypothetical protein